MGDVKAMELFKVMKSSGNYDDEDSIVETIEEMRERVADGEDPEELLHEEGFEPDYVFDLIG